MYGTHGSLTLTNAYGTGSCMYYAFTHYFRAYFYAYEDKFTVKHYAILCRQQPHTSRVYSVLLIALFSLALDVILCCLYSNIPHMLVA